MQPFVRNKAQGSQKLNNQANSKFNVERNLLDQINKKNEYYGSTNSFLKVSKENLTMNTKNVYQLRSLQNSKNNSRNTSKEQINEHINSLNDQDCQDRYQSKYNQFFSCFSNNNKMRQTFQFSSKSKKNLSNQVDMSLIQSNKQLLQENSDLRDQLERVQLQIDKLDDMYSRNKSQLDMTKSQLRDRSVDHKNMKAIQIKANELESDNKNIKSQFQKLEDSSKKDKHKLRNLETRNQELQSQVDTLNSKLRSKDKKYEQLQDQYNKSKQESQKVQFQSKLNEEKYKRKLLDLEQKFQNLYNTIEQQQQNQTNSQETEYLKKQFDNLNYTVKQKDIQIQQQQQTINRLEKDIQHQKIYDDGQLLMLFDNLRNYQDYIQNKNMFINEIDNQQLLISEIQNMYEMNQEIIKEIENYRYKQNFI